MLSVLYYVSAGVGCFHCVDGTYQPALGATVCLACQPGSYSGPGLSWFLANCSFVPSLGQSVCTLCKPGYYQNDTQQSSCKLCYRQQSVMAFGLSSCPCDPFFDCNNQGTCNTDGSCTCNTGLAPYLGCVCPLLSSCNASCEEHGICAHTVDAMHFGCFCPTSTGCNCEVPCNCGMGRCLVDGSCACNAGWGGTNCQYACPVNYNCDIPSPPGAITLSQPCMTTQCTVPGLGFVACVAHGCVQSNARTALFQGNGPCGARRFAHAMVVRRAQYECCAECCASECLTLMSVCSAFGHHASAFPYDRALPVRRARHVRNSSFESVTHAVSQRREKHRLRMTAQRSSLLCQPSSVLWLSSSWPPWSCTISSRRKRRLQMRTQQRHLERQAKVQRAAVNRNLEAAARRSARKRKELASRSSTLEPLIRPRSDGHICRSIVFWLEKC